MTMRVFTDIETLPPERGALSRYPKVCGCNEEQFRQLALTGDYGRVLTIGLIVEYDGRIIHEGCLGRDRRTMLFHLDEHRTLAGFWKLLEGFNLNRDLVVGHNIFSFDLNFIYKRSVVNKVKPSLRLSFARYKSQPLFDTMHEWNKWDMRKSTSLDELARILGLASSKSDEIDGARIYDRFCTGHHELIASYCMADVRLTRAIYYRLTQPDRLEME